MFSLEDLFLFFYVVVGGLVSLAFDRCCRLCWLVPQILGTSRSESGYAVPDSSLRSFVGSRFVAHP